MSSSPRCATCGALTSVEAGTCGFCHQSLAWEGAPPPTPATSVEEAVTAWGRTISTAPRQLGRLVRTVEVKDEVIERLFTTVIRRDVHEVRGRGPSGRPAPVRVDSRTVDPYAASPEQLREASQHVATCAACGGAGAVHDGAWPTRRRPLV